MKKLVLILTILFSINIINGQESTTISASNSGYVTKYLLGYNSTTDIIKVGQKNSEGKHRGYIEFSIFGNIPPNALISNITLHVNTQEPSDEPDSHRINVRSLPENSASIPISDLWNLIGEGNIFASNWDAMSSSGPKEILLNGTANTFLQNILLNSDFWWYIGLQEDLDDNDPGILYGYDASGNQPPYIVVEYYIPPEADFVADNIEPTTDETVNFTDQSINNPTSWSWVFTPSSITYMEGTNSNSQNPKVRFDLPDIYTVELTATNDGGSDTEIKTNYITATNPPPGPVAKFSGNPLSLPPEEYVQFTDESTGDPTSWVWTFEEGNPGNSTLQNPLIQYNDEGDFDVSLTVTNADGSDIETKTEYIHVSFIPPSLIADFEADNTNISIGESANFTDQSEGVPNEWLWTFEGGDPSTSTIQHPTNIKYDIEGSWDVTLFVKNASSEEDTELKSNYINVGITYLQVGDLEVYADDIVNLSGSLYNVSGNVSINHIIKFSKPLLVDTDDLTIVSDPNCLMHLDSSTGFSPDLPLYFGEFGFDVIESTLFNSDIGGSNMFQMTLLDVSINDIEVIANGIIINGELSLPDIMGDLDVDINTIVLETGNINFTGLLSVGNVAIFNTFNLNGLDLFFDTYNDNFSGEADMEFYNGLGLQIGAVIQQGNLDAVDVTAGLPIPIPGTGFRFNWYGGSVSGLAYPPLKLQFGTNIEPIGSFDVVELNSLYLLYTWGTSLEGGGDLLVFNANVASMFMRVTSNLLLFQGSVTIVPNSQFVLGDIEACLTSYNSNIDFTGSMYACLQIPDNSGFPFGLIRCFVDLPYIVAQTDNYIHNTALSGNFSLFSFKGHYQLEYQNPGIYADFGIGWIDLDKLLFSDEYLVYNPQLKLINNLEGTSLLISKDHPNKWLTIDGDSFIQTFPLDLPSSSLVIRMDTLNTQSFSIVLPDGTLVTPANHEQITNVDFLVNEEEKMTYYLINNPQLGSYSVNMESESDTILMNIFTKSVSPTIQLNENINLIDSIQISWLDSDIDSDASISLYYDDDNHGANGRKIIAGISENDIIDLYYWNTDSIPTGIYYVYGAIDDFIYNPTISYAPNPVKIINEYAPPKPSDLSGFISDSSIFLNWTYPLQDSAIRFILYYTTDSIYPSYNSSSFNIGNITSYEFKNFLPGNNYHFMVTAIDTNYYESDHSNIFDIAYQSTSLNNAPNILPQSIPDIVYADSAYSYQLICSDPDVNDVLTYELYCLLGSDTLLGGNTIDINSNGLITWNPAMNDLGHYTIILKVNDFERASDSLTYSLKVLDPTIAKINVELNNPLYSCFGGSCFVSVLDNTLLNSNEKIDSVDFRVYSNADPVGIIVSAVETEPGSDYYRAIFEFSGLSSSYKELLVDTTDVILVEYINPSSNDTVFDLSYFSYEPLVVNVTIIGDSIFCDGDLIDVTLYADEGHTSYLWSDGFTKTQTLDVTEPGYYTVLVSNENGCIRRSDTIRILPLPTPVVELSASDTINICEGFELNPGLCEDSCIYIWNTGDTSNTILIYEPGNYNVTVTNKYQCAGYDNVYINEVNNIPISDFTYSFGQSNIVFFENISDFGLIYFWEFGDGYTSTMENPSHMYDEIGIYEIILNVTNNCGISTISKTINVTDVAEHESNTNVSVYPNPTNNYINIKIRNLKLNENVNISITDFAGNSLKSISVNNSTGYLETSLNISDLSEGIYFLKILSKNNLITRKIIKL